MSKQWNRLWSAALACAALLFAGHSAARAQTGSGLLISPLNRTIQGRPGARDAAEFRISNNLKTRMVIAVALRDITQNESGGPILSDIGTTPRSAAKWISMTQGNLSLAPGQSETIRAAVAIPSGVSGSYHAAITLQLLGANRPESSGTVAKLVTQTILPIHVFISGTQKPAVQLENAELKPALGNIMSMEDEENLRGKWVLVPRVQNTGNAMVRLKGDVVVTSLRGELIGRYQVNNGDPDGQAVLPGATVEFPILVNSTLAEEQYPARISLRFQGVRRVEGYSAPMTLKPRFGGGEKSDDRGEVALGTVERTGLQALLEPRVVIGNVQPNSVRTQRITVTNLEDFPVSVAASASGLAIDVDGEPIALPDAATSSWMAIAPSNFRLGAQQSRVVSVRMNAPADAGDRWGLLQFAMASAAPNRSTLTTTVRTTVLLRNAAGAAGGQAQVEKVALTRSSEGPIVSVTVVNAQARPLAFSASSLRLAPAGIAPAAPASKTGARVLAREEEAESGVLNIQGETNLVLLPGASRRLDFQLPAKIQPAAYDSLMTLSGLAAATGTAATPDFSVAFKLNLTAPKAPAKAPNKASGAGKASAASKKAAPKKAAPKPAAKRLQNSR